MDQKKLTPFAWLRGGRSRASKATVRRQGGLRGHFECESLEGRVVLSHGGFGGFEGPADFQPVASLTVDLATTGVLANFGAGIDAHGGWEGGSASTSQLSTDLSKLKTDLQALAAKSGVTLADVNNLRADDLAIIQTGFRPDTTQLQAAITSLATAIASGSDTAQAKADFNAVFAGSSVSQDVVDKAFADVSQAITDSKITTSDLDTIAADQAAVKADLDSLQPSGSFNQHGGGTLVSSLAKLGVLGGLEGETGRGGLRGRRGGFPNTSMSQLGTDIQKLQTDLTSVAIKSGVTVSDLTALRSDATAIAQTGFHPDATKLDAAVSELAQAVVAGSDTTQARADFAAVFSGSGVTQDLIDKAFSDLVQTVTDSKVTATDLDTIAADRAAIAADLASLKSGSSTTSTTSSSTSSASATNAGKSTTTTATTNLANRFRNRLARRTRRR